MTVAVVAGGHGGRDVGFAQRHGLAVVGVPVARQPVGVAFAAARVADGFEIVALGIHDVMRGVTVRADRPARITLREQLPVNAFVVGFLDANVAFPAGLRDIRVVDGRVAIHGAFDVVRAVAIVAGRRDDQPHFEQRLTVDAVQVLRRGLRMLHLVFARQVGVVVAPRASLREIQFEQRRRRVLDGQDVVRTVAVPAIGRARCAHCVAHAVDARRVILRLLVMAAGTIRRRQVGVVNQLLHAGVTIGAVQRVVDGFVETVRREDRERNLDSVHHPGVVGIQVAVETIRIRQLLDGVGPRRRGRCSQAEKQPAEHRENRGRCPAEVFYRRNPTARLYGNRSRKGHSLHPCV